MWYEWADLMYHLCFCEVMNSLETGYLNILNQSVLTAMSSYHRAVVGRGAFHIRGHSHIAFSCWEEVSIQKKEKNCLLRGRKNSSYLVGRFCLRIWFWQSVIEIICNVLYLYIKTHGMNFSTKFYSEKSFSSL